MWRGYSKIHNTGDHKDDIKCILCCNKAKKIHKSRKNKLIKWKGLSLHNLLCFMFIWLFESKTWVWQPSFFSTVYGSYCIAIKSRFLLRKTIYLIYKSFSHLPHPPFPSSSSSYGGRRLYQYNEDDFRFQFWFIPSFKIGWIHT